MKRLILALSWFFLASGLVFSSVAGFLIVSKQAKQPEVTPTNVLIFSAGEDAALPPSGQVQGVSTVVEYGDSRHTIVANFLARYDSPLKPHDEYGRKFVEIADRYNLDFRLLPAIAMQESNLCKAVPEGTYNCLGFGIHERGTLGFESWEAGFDRAAREIKQRYVDIGLTTPEEIMTKYTPSSNGSWAASVNQWMAEMRYDDRKLGRELKTDANVLEFTASDATESAITGL